MKRLDLTPHMPPGMEVRQERDFFLVALGAAWVYSGLFFIRYFNAVDNLYSTDRITRKKILIPDAVMPDFAELFDGALTFFVYPIGAVLIFALLHYLYHYRHTKSIYLMRRLPHPMELHRRCLTLPLWGMGISLASAALILLLYFGIYMLFTPDGYITAGQWAKLWRL